MDAEITSMPATREDFRRRRHIRLLQSAPFPMAWARAFSGGSPPQRAACAATASSITTANVLPVSVFFDEP